MPQLGAPASVTYGVCFKSCYCSCFCYVIADTLRDNELEGCIHRLPQETHRCSLDPQAAALILIKVSLKIPVASVWTYKIVCVEEAAGYSETLVPIHQTTRRHTQYHLQVIHPRWKRDLVAFWAYETRFYELQCIDIDTSHSIIYLWPDDGLVVEAETCCHLVTLNKINIHNTSCVLTCESLLLTQYHIFYAVCFAKIKPRLQIITWYFKLWSQEDTSPVFLNLSTK